MLTDSDIRRILNDRMDAVDGEASVTGLMNYMFYVYNDKYPSGRTREIAKEIVGNSLDIDSEV